MTVGLTNGPYANMKFAPYEFKEFPKRITVKGGKRVLVHNIREEVAAIAEFGEGPKLAKDNDPIVEERNALAQALAQARAKLVGLEQQLAESKGNAIVSETPGITPTLAKPSIKPAAKQE